MKCKVDSCSKEATQIMTMCGKEYYYCSIHGAILRSGSRKRLVNGDDADDRPSTDKHSCRIL